MEDQMLEFLARYWAGLEDESDYALTDADDVPTIPVNPHKERALNAFALSLRRAPERAEGFAPANLVVRADNTTHALWFVARINPSASKQVNLLRQIRHQYGVRFEGEPVDKILNPLFHDEDVIWRDGLNQLAVLRYAIREAKEWHPSMPPEFLARGGASTSPAKRSAARANWTLARQTKTATALDRARARLALADVMEPEQVADAIGCTVESLPKLLRRARQRVERAEQQAGNVVALPQQATEAEPVERKVPRLSIEEVEALLFPPSSNP